MLFKSDAFNKVEINVKTFHEAKIVSQIRTHSTLLVSSKAVPRTEYTVTQSEYEEDSIK